MKRSKKNKPMDYFTYVKINKALDVAAVGIVGAYLLYLRKIFKNW